MNRKQFTKTTLIFTVLLASLIFATQSVSAQYLWNNDSSFKAGAPNSGRLWGYVFGDFYYKAHGDTINRGGSNQYTGIPQYRSEFQTRRIYLGYDYNISKKFSAELLLAAEDNITTGGGTTSGDLLGDNKLAFYIKLANIRWKNIWKGTDLVIGQVATPAFPLLSERVWNYRSIERTIIDVRRTPSYDLGATLQGKFDSKGNYGYNVMVGNGTSAKPETDNFKWFYGDVWAMFLDKKLVVDLYADYERLNWTKSWHHSRQMVKGYIAYTTPGLTIGAEGYINNLKNDNFATKIGGGIDTLDNKAKGLSFYIHGDIIKNSLRFFARYDWFNPTNTVDNNLYSKYTGNTANYNDPNTKETFYTLGLDFTPVKGVHFMPNVWCTQYINNSPVYKYNSYDLVWRLTVYFVFGK